MTYPTPVVLKWAPVDGAAQYTVSLSNSSNMSNPTSTDTEGTNFAPPAWMAPGVHYWTVTAKDARGNPVGTSPTGGIGSAFTWVWPSTVSGLGCYEQHRFVGRRHRAVDHVRPAVQLEPCVRRGQVPG